MAIRQISRYEVLRTLGRGSMGVVYLARDPLIDRQVAVKTLRVDHGDDVTEEFRERFLREAQAAGRLNHPGIVTVHDVGEDPDSGLAFIAMEYLEGRNLKEMLADGVSPPFPEVARLVAAVAEALAYAHRMGVIHRDVKPANIICTESGAIKITDFGIARVEASDLTHHGEFLGTPNYMSPEQVSAQPADARSDIFSLGVVLYELLAGRLPFPGKTLPEVTARIVTAPAPTPSAEVADCPPGFDPIVARCLAKEKDERYQSGAELAVDLRTLARELGAEAHEPGEWRHLPPPLPRGAGRRDASTLLLDATPERAPGLRQRLRQLPLPEPLRWEVQGRWVAAIAGGWLALWLLVGVVLALRVDDRVPPSPSAAAIQARHQLAQTLRQAQARLDAGDARGAEEAASAVLDQAPASPSARSLVSAARRQREAAERDQEQQQRAQQLLAEGRRMYENGAYGRAAERFRDVLRLERGNELAASFLLLAEEHLRQPADGGPRSASPGGVDADIPQVTTAAAQLQGEARLTVFFDSPLNAGAIVISLDGSPAVTVPFDFTRRGFLGVRRTGTGQVKKISTLPAGRHRLTAELVDEEQGSRGSRTFDVELEPANDYRLRVVLPRPEARPEFSLTPSRG